MDDVSIADAATTSVALSEHALWYKDAIIYQLHVKSFFDANNDGIGDFAGLISKLDYIADLGVNTIWLLPFYPVATARRWLRHRRLSRRASRLSARWPTSGASSPRRMRAGCG